MLFRSDLWRGLAERFLDAVQRLAPDVSVSLWPGEHRQLQRWLEIGLIDLAFDHLAHDSEGCTSRVICEDVLALFSSAEHAAVPADAHHVYVDHGDEFRRRHAEAFPDAPIPAVTLASSDWAAEYLLRRPGGACGYLPMRHAEAGLREGRLRRVRDAPTLDRKSTRLNSSH